MLGVEKSKEKKWKVDQKFTNMSHIRPYKYWGGAFPGSMITGTCGLNPS
jgi:hypothetical protein